MVLGASPCAPDFCGIGVDVVAVAGASILLRQPDIYCVAEMGGCYRYINEVREMQAAGGKLIAHSTVVYWVDVRRVTPRPPWPYPDPYPADEVVGSGRLATADKLGEWQQWQPGDIVLSNSGLMALQIAIRDGAREVHLVGMEGYRGLGDDYFMADVRIPKDVKKPTGDQIREWQTQYFRPLLDRIVGLCPEVDFVPYGTLRLNAIGVRVRAARRFDTAEIDGVQ